MKYTSFRQNIISLCIFAAIGSCAIPDGRAENTQKNELTSALSPNFALVKDIGSDDIWNAIFQAWPLKDNRNSQYHVSIRIKRQPDGLRTFELMSDAPQRDSGPTSRRVVEHSSQPRVDTGNPLFDSLFALTIDDMLLNSVDTISDSSYKNGQPIPCHCFQTGEKWKYVWTRDVSYAINLGLSGLDTKRSIDSLLFKVSPFRKGVNPPKPFFSGDRQIIQDTGSGGSWPVSTDRLTWAIAAESVIAALSGEEKASFSRETYHILKNTLQADRVAIFDHNDGLYRGEQSFLDWRTQTYAPWIIKNLSRLASSKALSTNVIHYQSLNLAAKLALKYDSQQTASRYQKQADELKNSINQHFWLPDEELYATFIGSDEDPSPVHKYDMLGSALVILSGVAPTDRAVKVLRHYPHSRFGVPVYYPQQPGELPYHNRSIWPFVTAYALQAAAKMANTQVADNAIFSLMRGTATNLSNMENLEWLTGLSQFAGGPVINSQRQLWSVAGYLNMVMQTVYGYHFDEDGVKIQPFLTSKTRNLFQQGSISLEGINYKGKSISIELILPEANLADGYFPLDRVNINGKDFTVKFENGDKVPSVHISDSSLKDSNIIRLYFSGLSHIQDGEITYIRDDKLDPKINDKRVYSPAAPEIKTLESADGKPRMTINFLHRDVDDLTYNVWLNGKMIAENLTPDEGTTEWTDILRTDDGQLCYAVEAKYKSSGNYSHHSEPACLPNKSERFIPVTDPTVVSNHKPEIANDYRPALPALINWGAQHDKLELHNLLVAKDGVYALSLLYHNSSDVIETGVINAVKRLDIFDDKNVLVGSGVIQMPSIQPVDGMKPFNDSTQFSIYLRPGIYTLKLSDYFNMSYLRTNETLSKSGGEAGPINKATIAGFKITKVGHKP